MFNDVFDNNGLESAPLMKRRKLMNGGNCVNGVNGASGHQMFCESIKPDKSKNENITKTVQQAQGTKRCWMVDSNVQKRLSIDCV